MTPEERAVIRAAIQIERDGASVPAAFSIETALATQSELPGDHPCENCLTDPDEDPAPWCDCRPDETCSGPCRRKAHDPARCPNLPAEAALAVWVPTTLLYCLAGDRIRIGTDETAVRRSSSGVWYVNAADYWHPTPWKHTELRLDLEANPGFQEYPPNTPCELLCGPSRLAVLELQKAFPGTTEVPRRRNR